MLNADEAAPGKRLVYGGAPGSGWSNGGGVPVSAASERRAERGAGGRGM
jgi:hypothetical protein